MVNKFVDKKRLLEWGLVVGWLQFIESTEIGGCCPPIATEDLRDNPR